MKPTSHAVISGVLGLAVAFWVNSLMAGVCCFFSGIFIDLDHVIDYFLSKKKFPSNYQDLKKYCDLDKSGKLYLFFHSIEIWIIFLFLGKYFDSGFIFVGVFWGAAIHLLCDQVANPLRPFGYFIFFRIGRSFEKEKVFTAEYFKKIS